MNEEAGVASPETASDESTSQIDEQTSSQNQTGLSQEALTELQNELDRIRGERDKYMRDYDQQKQARAKYEKLYKTEKGKEAEELDRVQQQLDIEKARAEDLSGRIGQMTQAQKKTAVQGAVMGIASTLADGAAADIAALMEAKVGIVDGRVVVLTETGTPKLSAKSGRDMTVDELRDELLSTRPYLVKNRMTPGQGTGANTTGATGVIKSLQEFNGLPPDEASSYWQTLTPEQKAIMRGQAK